MMFNATFNNISTISWQSVLLVEETGVPRENHWPLVSHWKLYHIMLHRVHSARVGFELTLVVMDTDCIGSCKSNYLIITAMTAPLFQLYHGVSFTMIKETKLKREKISKFIASCVYWQTLLYMCTCNWTVK